MLAVGLALAACATPPKDAGGEGRSTRGEPSGANAAATLPPAEPAAATEPTATEATANAGEPLKPLPEFSGVVELNRQPPAENTGQICRTMLRPNSMTHVRVCGTPAEWAKYTVAEAKAAEELLLKMQKGEMH